MGIEVNHGLAQAAALCPHIHILPFDAENERVMLSQLAHRLYPFASDIALDEHCGLAIRLDNLTHYYGGIRHCGRHFLGNCRYLVPPTTLPPPGL